MHIHYNFHAEFLNHKSQSWSSVATCSSSSVHHAAAAMTYMPTWLLSTHQSHCPIYARIWVGYEIMPMYQWPFFSTHQSGPMHMPVFGLVIIS